MAVLDFDVTNEKWNQNNETAVVWEKDRKWWWDENLPDSATNLGLVFREVDVLKDHVLAIAHVVFVIFVT